MKGICLCHVAATACESCDKLRVLHVLLLLRRPYKDLIGPRLGFTNSFSDRDGFLLVCLSETINPYKFHINPYKPYNMLANKLTVLAEAEVLEKMQLDKLAVELQPKVRPREKRSRLRG